MKTGLSMDDIVNLTIPQFRTITRAINALDEERARSERAAQHGRI